MHNEIVNEMRKIADRINVMPSFKGKAFMIKTLHKRVKTLQSYAYMPEENTPRLFLEQSRRDYEIANQLAAASQQKLKNQNRRQ